MFALADCNNFFASCERVFRPDLQGKPVIVLSNNDGCAIARSNEAKALGIRMGDPFFKIKGLVEKFTSLIAANGEIAKVEEWGKRRMAYAIDDMPEGYYTLVEFDAKPDFPAELDRIYKITDGIIRSIIVAKE